MDKVSWMLVIGDSEHEHNFENEVEYDQNFPWIPNQRHMSLEECEGHSLYQCSCGAVVMIK